MNIRSKHSYVQRSLIKLTQRKCSPSSPVKDNYSCVASDVSLFCPGLKFVIMWIVEDILEHLDTVQLREKTRESFLFVSSNQNIFI